MYGEDVRTRAEPGDRKQVLHRVERQAGMQRGGGRECRRVHQQVVAVGRRARDDLHAEDAARATTVVHHHRLSHRFGESLTDQACEHVDTTPRRERNHQPERP
jgi:hypothetical protein